MPCHYPRCSSRADVLLLLQLYSMLRSLLLAALV
jgi:hypothetical protein